MKPILIILALASMAFGADTLQLRDGRTFTGQFVGATGAQIWFHRDGQVETAQPIPYPIGQVASLVFDRAGSPLGASAELRKPVDFQPARKPVSVLDWLASLQRNYAASFFPKPRVQYFAFSKE